MANRASLVLCILFVSVHALTDVTNLRYADDQVSFHLAQKSFLFDIHRYDGRHQHGKAVIDGEEYYGTFRMSNSKIHFAYLLGVKTGHSIMIEDDKIVTLQADPALVSRTSSIARTPTEDERTHFKRDAKAVPAEGNYNGVCKINIVADNYFTNRPDFAGSVTAVTNYAADLVASANVIFKSRFQDSVTLELGNVRVITTANNAYQTLPASTDPILDLHSILTTEVINGGEEDACYVHLFTYRNFDGFMGIAWTPGICEDLGYNTAVTTTVYPDGATSPKYNHMLSFTHETGHSFGSRHDATRQTNPAECQPMYIMWPSTYQTILENSPNRETFSTCSVSEMTPKVESCIGAPSSGVSVVPSVVIMILSIIAAMRFF